MQRSRAKARTEETAEDSTRATIRRTRQTDDNGANGPSQAGDSGGPAAHGSDQDFDQRILGMEKAVGTAFYRNNLGEYGWVNRSTSQSSSRCGRQAERPADASSVDQYVISTSVAIVIGLSQSFTTPGRKGAGSLRGMFTSGPC